MDGITDELINTIKNLAPEVWGIMMKQVYAECVSNIIWAIALIIGTVLLVRLSLHFKSLYEKQSSYDMNEIGIFFSAFLALAAGTEGLFLVTDAIKYVINPDFYAIQYLLGYLN